MIYIDNKKKSEQTLQKLYPNAKIVDVTSKATTGLVKLSPFYPHGDIPIPFSNGKTAKSVEGIWQGLKVFDNTDIDITMFENITMKNIKRTVRKYGKPLGHRKGIYGNELLDYINARIEIYLPSYLWVLENKVQSIIERLKVASETQDIVLLDYETNCNVLNFNKPLSHAYLVKAYVEGNYPTVETLKREKVNLDNSIIEQKPKTQAVKKIKKENTFDNGLFTGNINYKNDLQLAIKNREIEIAKNGILAGLEDSLIATLTGIDISKVHELHIMLKK